MLVCMVELQNRLHTAPLDVVWCPLHSAKCFCCSRSLLLLHAQLIARIMTDTFGERPCCNLKSTGSDHVIRSSLVAHLNFAPADNAEHQLQRLTRIAIRVRVEFCSNPGQMHDEDSREGKMMEPRQLELSGKILQNCTTHLDRD